MNKNLINQIKTVFAVAIVLISFNVYADELLIKGGVRSGGDNVITIQDYDDTNFGLEASGGLSLAGGINFNLSEKQKFRVTIGYVTNTLKGKEIFTNSAFTYKWSHFPLDYLIFHQTKYWNFGVGLTLHLNPELKGSGYFAGQDIKFDNAVGLLAEIDYRFAKDFFIGLNYTSINYKGNNGRSYNGSGVGLDVGLAVAF